jgi:hypothetical protein
MTTRTALFFDLADIPIGDVTFPLHLFWEITFNVSPVCSARPELCWLLAGFTMRHRTSRAKPEPTTRNSQIQPLDYFCGAVFRNFFAVWRHPSFWMVAGRKIRVRDPNRNGRIERCYQGSGRYSERSYLSSKVPRRCCISSSRGLVFNKGTQARGGAANVNNLPPAALIWRWRK